MLDSCKKVLAHLVFIPMAAMAAWYFITDYLFLYLAIFLGVFLISIGEILIGSGVIVFFIWLGKDKLLENLFFIVDIGHKTRNAVTKIFK